MANGCAQGYFWVMTSEIIADPELDPTATDSEALETRPVDSVPRPVTATEFVSD